MSHQRKPGTSLTAVILAAGKGTRMRSARPKVLHRIAGRTLLDWAITAARQSGCERIIVLTGHGAEEVRRSTQGADIIWAHQTEQLGTGHALAQVEPHVPEPTTLLVLSGDVPLVKPETLEQLAGAADNAWGAMAVAELDEPGSLGRVLPQTARTAEDPRLHGYLDDITEASDATPEELTIRLINAGLYALPAPEIFHFLRQLEPDNAQGEYYLTDAVGLAARDRDVALLDLADPTEAFGVNDRRDLARAQAALQRRLLDDLMGQGVTILDPERTVVDHGVHVEPDTVIHPGVSLSGNTLIGSGCEIHQGCWIHDSQLGEGIVVKPYCVLDGAEVADDCSIGPFARLRPASVLLEGAQVGNFVELKKTRLGAGAKASHLTYLGDATVGEKANIGAGVVTCNFDGVAKHRTEIGDRAFVGSDTMLVAPVRVGDRASTGAGSVINHDVPDGAMGIGRARQRTIPDWDKRRAGKASGED